MTENGIRSRALTEWHWITKSRLAIQQSQTAIAIKGAARMPFYAISDWSAKKISRLSSLVSRLFIIFAK